MIREGKLTREKALGKIARSREEIAIELEVAEKVVQRLQLGKNKMEKILNFYYGPPKLINPWR